MTHAESASPTLHYGAVSMSWEPVNRASSDIVRELRRGHQVFVRLEPGDATRYDFLVTWPVEKREPFQLSDEQAREALIVVRLVSGEVLGATLYGWMNYGSVSQLSNGNEWTAMLLTWWLDELLRRLNT